MENEAASRGQTVWPPSPLGAASLAAWFPFRSLHLRMQGEASGFQRGWIGIEPTGVIISGKRVLPFSGQIILLTAYLLRDRLPFHIWLLLLAAALVCLLLLYVFRKSRTLTVPWSQVLQIVLDEEKHRAGIVYEALDHAGKIKTYSLVFSLNAAMYPSFVNTAEKYAPGRSLADKLRGESMVPFLLIGVNMLVVLLAAFLLFKLIGHH